MLQPDQKHGFPEQVNRRCRGEIAYAVQYVDRVGGGVFVRVGLGIREEIKWTR